MQRIETYISNLLYQHNCVIVPGLGGFVLNYQSARIHPMSYIFNSPTKSVAFNVNLKNNDGLLTNYVAETEKISHNKAEDIVRIFVDDIHNELREKKAVKLINIGRLLVDIENAIQFIPDTSNNYLLPSYGLRSITAEPILREKEASIIHIKTKKAELPKRKKNALKIILPIAAIFILALITLQFFVLSNDTNKNYSEVIQVKQIFRHEKISAHTYTVSNSTTTKQLLAHRKTDVDSSLIMAEETKINDMASSEPLVAQQINTSSYYIIAGVYGKTSYAQNIINALAQKGYKAFILERNNNQMVAVNIPDDISPAQFRKTFADDTAISDAWVMKDKNR